LAEHHGARRLLLVSRSGEGAPGAADLKAELEELGAKARIAACDVSDRDQLKELIDSIEAEHPLGAVIHAAGVFDNGLIADLDQERLDRVLAPKIDAAHHLHELSKDQELSAFVLFSSAAGLLGGPGQGNYAAANSFLDALAAQRRREGLPAISLAWGMWDQESNLVGELSEADAERFLRQTRMLLGFSPIPAERGLGLFDQVASFADPLLAPVHFDRAALRAQAKAGSLPALMRGLIRVPSTRQRGGDSLSTSLGGVPETERETFVLDFVRGHVAAVLGHDSAAAIEPGKAFKDLGFDSLAAVELRNRLVAATDLRLPATLVFDYPTTGALASFLSEKVSPAQGNGLAVDPREHEVRQVLTSIPLARLRRAGLMDQLMRLASLDEEAAVEATGDDDDIDAMDVDELVQMSTEGTPMDSPEGAE
jgi:polyketide synthase 12